MIADGRIYGRGTLDDKIGVIGLLEALERLLAEGFAPRKTIVLGFGHDEDRYVEIWNNVFMQYERSADGSMKPLPKNKSIEIGVQPDSHTSPDSCLVTMTIMGGTFMRFKMRSRIF